MVLETTQSMVEAEHWPVVLPKHQLQKCTDNVLGATIKEYPNATHGEYPRRGQRPPPPVCPICLRGRLGDTVSHSGLAGSVVTQMA